MKLKANDFEVLKSTEKIKLVLVIDKESAKEVEKMNKKQDFSSDLEVVIEKYRKKRSTDHNRLFWDMCDCLAEHIDDPLITKDDIYRDLIRNYGVSTITPQPDDLVDFVIETWEARGDGWLTEKQRKSKLDGNYTNVKFYWGSSVYNSKMMWALVQGLKYECYQHKLDISRYDKEMTSLLNKLETEEKAVKDGKQ